jgi:ABC-type glycerol-3-phosphate transport system substrate-binding protein
MMKKMILLTSVIAILLAACSAATPLPQDGETISWDHAVELLRGGHVTMAFQAHSMDVTLELENGARVHTVEPHLDAIFQEIEACGAPCADIAIATE